MTELLGPIDDTYDDEDTKKDTAAIGTEHTFLLPTQNVESQSSPVTWYVVLTVTIPGIITLSSVLFTTSTCYMHRGSFFVVVCSQNTQLDCER